MMTRLFRIFRRLRALPLQTYYTLSGWRFGDLKDYIDLAVGREADLTMATLESGTLLETAGRAPVAVVTCLPPDDSGIANFSSKHLPLVDSSIDVYSQVRDVARFLRQRVSFERQSNGRVRLYPMSSLLARDEGSPYNRIVFVLGNSEHNVEVFRSMEALSSLGGMERAACYLHDPCCHNVVQLGKQHSATDYLAFLSKLYGVRIAGHSGMEGWQAHRAALDAGALGVRALVELGIRHIVVNSQAASDLVLNDLDEAQREQVRTSILFHPVFPVEVSQEDHVEKTGFTVGCFGVAGLSKGTDVVIEAVRLLRARGVPARLVLAGYHTKHFVEHSFAGQDMSWIESAEPKTERDLQLDMLKCDVAVQLRRQNLGESSGVVPTLVGLGIPTIVSPIGAFTEYGDAVNSFAGYDASKLADLLQQRSTVSAAAMRTYSDEHNVDEFNRRLLSILGIGRHNLVAIEAARSVS